MAKSHEEKKNIACYYCGEIIYGGDRYEKALEHKCPLQPTYFDKEA